jgi:cobalamin biosynthetic protein CobC
MAMMTLPVHGGDLEAAELRWGRPAGGWVDLSTGINPWPYPVPELAQSAWARLPGSGAEHALVLAAARRYHLPAGLGEDAVVAAAGSQALIQALPRQRKPGSVAILGPTYGEHARAWDGAGHAVVLAESLDALDGASAALVVNPNNPDGRVVPPAELVALADRMAARGGVLVVDEAFGDLRPELSLVPHLRPGLVVLRSFGKFYGLAGVRLGFALGLPEMLAPLRAWLGPWAVSGPALAVGAIALADDDWAEATACRLAEAAGRLDEVLSLGGARVVGGTSLFRLIEHPAAAALYDHFGRAGILVRAFAGRPRLLRCGLPDGEAALERLRSAVTGFTSTSR